MNQTPDQRRRERGMVTFELAIGMLTASVLTALLGWGVSLVALQGRCADAAAQVARQVARGDQQAAEQARGLAPDGARFQTESDGEQVRVTVLVDARWGAFGPVEVRGTAIMARE